MVWFIPAEVPLLCVARQICAALSGSTFCCQAAKLLTVIWLDGHFTKVCQNITTALHRAWLKDVLAQNVEWG